MRIERHGAKWKVRKTIRGKKYYLFFDFKPTQKDIRQEIERATGGTAASGGTSEPMQQQRATGGTAANGGTSEPMQQQRATGGTAASGGTSEPMQQQEKKKYNGNSLYIAIKRYIRDKKNILSPSTIRGYIIIHKFISNDLLSKDIKKIDNEILQKYINKLALEYSRKRIKNIIGLITATLNYNGIGKRFFLQYPNNIIKAPYIPTDLDIKKLDTELKGTKYYTFFRLALYGLRVSEILGLTMQDINFTTGILNINKAKVNGVNYKLITKTTKTKASTRQLKIDYELLNIIKNQKEIILVKYRTFYEHFISLQNKLNITNFSPHKLRHFFASKLHSLNIPDKYIQVLGGWTTDNTLKKVYTHILQDETLKINNKLLQDYIEPITKY